MLHLHIRYAEFQVPVKYSGVDFQQVIKNESEVYREKVRKNLEKHLHISRTETLGGRN